MSLETVVADIRAEAEERAEEIRAEAETEAERIIADAETDAEETMAAAEAEVERRIERERHQQISSAELQSKQEVLAARRDVLEDVLEEVEDALADLSGDRRQDLTRILLENGVDQFDADDSVEVAGREADRELLESLVEEQEDVTVAGTYDCLGGVVLESEGSRVRVNNTFDAILDDVWEDELKAISDRLFEQ